MDLRLHPCSVDPAEDHEKCGPNRPTAESSCNNAMLDHEVRGRDYNKSAHRRRLAALLHHRTDGAIERKHQNISAILIELGFVYVVGCKPLRNYQQLLFETVENRLAQSQLLADVVRQQVSEPAPVPTVDDILASLVETHRCQMPTVPSTARR